jgi:hypothetical protein
MKARFVEDKNEIALAHGRTIESIGAIETHIQFFGIALKFVARQAIDMEPAGIVKAFLARKHDKPMITREARRPAFPNLPLMKAHRSGRCLTLAMADSRRTRSLSVP